MSNVQHEARQFRTWLTCQVCGMVTHRDKAASGGWLVSPRKKNPAVLIIRCPWDVSEWALRESEMGRPRKWIAYIKHMRTVPRPAIPPALQPHPVQDE